MQLWQPMVNPFTATSNRTLLGATTEKSTCRHVIYLLQDNGYVPLLRTTKQPNKTRQVISACKPASYAEYERQPIKLQPHTSQSEIPILASLRSLYMYNPCRHVLGAVSLSGWSGSVFLGRESLLTLSPLSSYTYSVSGPEDAARRRWLS